MESHKTTFEMAEKWGVSPKTVQNLCRRKKIPGAVKRAGVWFIPEHTPNPMKNTRAGADRFSFVGTKKKIFDAAIDLFTSRGFENVSVKDIAEVVGIRQSAIYNHFKSKADLLDTIYEFYSYYYLVNRPTLNDVEPVLRSGSIEEIIRSLWYGFGDRYIMKTMVNISKLVFQRQGIDDRAREYISNLVIKEGEKFVEKVFSRAVEIGRIAPVDAHVVALFINIVRLYTLNLAILDPSPEGVYSISQDEQALYSFLAQTITDLGPIGK